METLQRMHGVAGSRVLPLERQQMTGVLRCESCGDVIGVYEPLVRLLDGSPYETSRALESHLTDRHGACYHRICYTRLDDSALPASE